MLSNGGEGAFDAMRSHSCKLHLQMMQLDSVGSSCGEERRCFTLEQSE